jgi:hypothetical protein
MSANGAEATASVIERLELGRYTVRGAERILCGERVDRFVYVTDHPATEAGSCYFVDRCLVSDGYSSLEALVEDYTRQARRLQQIPMLASEVTRIDQVELGRYRFTGGVRVLYGQRVNGVVRITDRPASGPGRAYLVECGVECDGYSALRALVADYTRQADSLDAVPMAAGAVRRIVEEDRSPGVNEASRAATLTGACSSV